MSGISKYKYQNSKFDTEDELMKLELIRLVHLQKIQLENINNCINDSTYTINKKCVKNKQCNNKHNCIIFANITDIARNNIITVYTELTGKAV